MSSINFRATYLEPLNILSTFAVCVQHTNIINNYEEPDPYNSAYTHRIQDIQSLLKLRQDFRCTLKALVIILLDLKVSLVFSAPALTALECFVLKLEQTDKKVPFELNLIFLKLLMLLNNHLKTKKLQFY